MSATNRGAIRRPGDVYPTPAYCIDLLLPYIDLSRVRRFLEPCKGTGVIYDKVAVPHKHWCEIAEDRDYLTTEFEDRFDLIVTNPPYSLALEFLQKSLREADTVIYFLPSDFLGSRRRCEFHNTNRFTHLLTVAKRPSFTGNGKTDQAVYAWFIWNRAGIIALPYGHWALHSDHPIIVGQRPQDRVTGHDSPGECVICGAPLLRSRRDSKTCGQRCKQQAYRNRIKAKKEAEYQARMKEIAPRLAQLAASIHEKINNRRC